MVLNKKDREALRAEVGKRSPLVQRPAGLDAYRALGETYVRYRCEDLDAATGRLGAVDASLDVPRLTEEQQKTLRLTVYNGQESVVRGFAGGLRQAAAAAAATAIQPEALTGLLGRREELWRVQLAAARIKSRALDALLLTDSFGGDLIARIVTWLEEELRRPDLTVAARERLLVTWGPFLTLLNQDQSLKKGRAGRKEAAAGRLEQTANAAETELRVVQARRAVREGDVPPDEELLGLAREMAGHIDPPAAPRRGRRPKRR